MNGKGQPLSQIARVLLILFVCTLTGNLATLAEVEEIDPRIGAIRDSEGGSPAPDPAPSSEPFSSRRAREETRWTALATYSLIDTWVPSKFGVTLAYLPDSCGSWELDYLWGRLSFGFLIADLGSLTDQRLSLVRRSYKQRNSLNFIYGIYYNKLRAELGDEYLATVSGVAAANARVMAVEVVGASWGVGQRWQTSNRLVWSVDWLVVHIPLKVLHSEAPFIDATVSARHRDRVERAFGWFERIPTVAVLRAQVGVSF